MATLLPVPIPVMQIQPKPLTSDIVPIPLDMCAKTMRPLFHSVSLQNQTLLEIYYQGTPVNHCCSSYKTLSLV